MNDPRNKCCYFITLTYDDGHLPVMRNRYIDASWQNFLNQNRHYSARKYDYSYLRKDHAMKFLQDMKTALRSILLPSYVFVYNKKSPHHGEIIETEQGYRIRNLEGAWKYVKFRQWDIRKSWLRVKYPAECSNFRVFMTGEYGDISNRSHYHLLLFSPVELSKMDIMAMCKDCWPYGQFLVGESMKAAACNYVAKHQVKSCIGNSFQNAAFPIFALSTRWLGGIGRTMVDDQQLRIKYDNAMINHDRSMMYIENQQKKGDEIVTYKVPFPRFLTRIYHPDLLDNEELEDLQSEASKNLKRFIVDNSQIFPNLVPSDFNIGNCNFETEIVRDDPRYRYSQEHYERLDACKRVVYSISQELKKEDEIRRQLYEKSRLNKKFKKMLNSNDTEFNSF